MCITAALIFHCCLAGIPLASIVSSLSVPLLEGWWGDGGRAGMCAETSRSLGANSDKLVVEPAVRSPCQQTPASQTSNTARSDLHTSREMEEVEGRRVSLPFFKKILQDFIAQLRGHRMRSGELSSRDIQQWLKFYCWRSEKECCWSLN